MKCKKVIRCLVVREPEYFGVDTLDQVEDLEHLYKVLGYDTIVKYNKGYVLEARPKAA